VLHENPHVSANDTEARFEQRRKALNQWMLRLPIKERRRRWSEYASRMCQLEKDIQREIELKKRTAVSSGPRTPITPPAATAITESASSRSERLRATESCNQPYPNN